METFYLIDFENVNSSGLTGCKTLTKSDHIIIFFTRQAMKINMSEIANHGEAALDMVEIPSGKQSADIHIGSYIGYLASQHKDKECTIVVVSFDTDFDNVLKFWSDKTGVKSLRTSQIKNPSTTERLVKEKKDDSANEQNNVDKEQLTQFILDIIQAITEDGFEMSVAKNVAQISVPYFGNSDLADSVRDRLRSRYTNYTEVFDAVKNVLQNYEKAAKISAYKIPEFLLKKKPDQIKDIVKILKENDTDDHSIEIVTMITYEYLEAANQRQPVYKAMVSSFGQKKGQQLYNLIKKILK